MYNMNNNIKNSSFYPKFAIESTERIPTKCYLHKGTPWANRLTISGLIWGTKILLSRLVLVSIQSQKFTEYGVTKSK